MLDNTQSIICAFGLAAAAPRSPYRHLELCGIAFRKMEFCYEKDFIHLPRQDLPGMIGTSLSRISGAMRRRRKSIFAERGYLI